MNGALELMLEDLRAATARPSWVQMNFTIEKIHSNMLVAAVNAGERRAAKRLAAELWSLAGGDPVDPEQIAEVQATPEFRLKPGPHGTIDLVVDLDLGGSHRRLAVEVKVDSVPWHGQLVSMRDALGNGADRRLALLCLGAAQASRVEGDGPAMPTVKRWSIAQMLGLRELIVAAAPVRADAEAWLAELEREEKRRLCAWSDEAAVAKCGYRGRLQTAYRFDQAARDLAAPGSEWEVSLQAFGVILHGKSSRWQIPGTEVFLYLEVADGALRVKSGAWYDGSDALAAAERLRSQIEEAFASHGFSVRPGVKRPGSSVTVMLIDPEVSAWPREPFLERLRRALNVWRAIDWPK